MEHIKNYFIGQFVNWLLLLYIFSLNWRRRNNKITIYSWFEPLKTSENQFLFIYKKRKITEKEKRIGITPNKINRTPNRIFFAPKFCKRKNPTTKRYLFKIF